MKFVSKSDPNFVNIFIKKITNKYIKEEFIKVINKVKQGIFYY